MIRFDCYLYIYTDTDTINMRRKRKRNFCREIFPINTTFLEDIFHVQKLILRQSIVFKAVWNVIHKVNEIRIGLWCHGVLEEKKSSLGISYRYEQRNSVGAQNKWQPSQTRSLPLDFHFPFFHFLIFWISSMVSRQSDIKPATNYNLKIREIIKQSKLKTSPIWTNICD